MRFQTDEAGLALARPKDQSVTRPLHNLRTPGLLARWPIIGVLMVVLGSGVFGVLAFNVQTNGPLIQHDPRFITDLHQFALQSAPFIQGIMLFGFIVGQYFIVAIGLILTMYFGRKHYWLELSMVVIAWAGEGALWLILSDHFNRPRPVLDVRLSPALEVPGFPSGHSLSAVMCYGLLAYLIAPRMASRIGKLVVMATAGLIILYIGFSRMFVGDHYLTDVLAGYGLGIAWSGFVYTSLEVLALRLKKSGHE